jgi:hypothetical protein
MHTVTKWHDTSFQILANPDLTPKRSSDVLDFGLIVIMRNLPGVHRIGVVHRGSLSVGGRFFDLISLVREEERLQYEFKYHLTPNRATYE